MKFGRRTDLVAARLNALAVAAHTSRVRLRLDGRSGSELGVRVLRQISHHRLFVHFRVDHFVRLDQLWDAEPAFGQVHGFLGVLQCVARVALVPIGVET